jgi:hypothetical protein
MLQGHTWQEKLPGLFLVAGLTAFFWIKVDGWWPYIWTALVAYGIIMEVRSLVRYYQKTEDVELFDVALDDDTRAEK